jgi:hypothetical protein
MTHASFTVCPFCSQENELASAVVKQTAPAIEPRMKPGDVTLCIQCGKFSVMGWIGLLRKPTDDEARELDRDSNIQKLREAWQDVRRQRQT